MRCSRRTLAALTILIIMTAGAAFCDNPGTSAVAHYQRGLQHKRNGELGAARRELQAAIAECTDYADAYWVLGWVEADLGNAEGACTSLNIFLRLAPDDPRCGEARDAIVRLGGRPSPTQPPATTGTELVGADEEFVGPFPSWRNVKTDYGAVGDGRADDTAAIQRGFDDLKKHLDACVLYFPAGTYRITDTVKTVREAHSECYGVTVIGEDPATTTIRWDGPVGGVMVNYDAWYSKISRLSLDGAGTAGIALFYGNSFSTYNETSDMVFQDVTIGMLMGTETSAGQAENEVLRCTFRRCEDAGLRTRDWNSMDVWVWYSLFEDCGWGLHNFRGNFHCYESLFHRSRKADIATRNLMVFSFINNTSVGSNCFVDFSGSHTWGSPTSITGNRVLEPTGDWAIRLSNGGPYLVMDNVIKARPGVTQPVVEMTWGDQLFVGNTYTIPDAVKEGKPPRFRRIAENTVAPEAVTIELPQLPPTPPHVDRPIIEVPAGADGQTIQEALDQAAGMPGRHPVVHLPKGTCKVDHTLVITAGSDVQLIGDGASDQSTVLQWTGDDGEPMLRLEGPSLATLRDFFLLTGNGDGIVVTNCDQQGGLVHADQLQVNARTEGSHPIGVLVSGLKHTAVQFRCLQGAYGCDPWVRAIGRAEGSSGAANARPVTIFCGATSTPELAYDVVGGAAMVVRSVYHEKRGDRPVPQAMRLTDRGSIAVDATRFNYLTAPDLSIIETRDFRGSLAVLTSILLPVGSAAPCQVSLTGDGRATRALIMADLFWLHDGSLTSDNIWLSRAAPPAQAAFALCRANGTPESGFPRESGYQFGLEGRGDASDDFVLEMLQPLREVRPWLPHPTPPGVTNLRLHRVNCGGSGGGALLELRSAAR
jgi:hypothetical protein